MARLSLPILRVDAAATGDKLDKPVGNGSGRAFVDLCQDRAWLNAFRAGDHAALEKVFRAYVPVVMLVLRRGGTSAHGGVRTPGIVDAAEQHDVMQEVFMRLFKAEVRARYDGLRPYGAFVRGVCANVMLDHLRKRHSALSKITESQEPQDLEQAWSPDQPLPDEFLLSKERQEAVNAFLKTLTPMEQRFVEARYVAGLSQRDAAQATQLTRQNIRTLEQDVVARFKAFWKKRSS